MGANEHEEGLGELVPANRCLTRLAFVILAAAIGASCATNTDPRLSPFALELVHNNNHWPLVYYPQTCQHPNHINGPHYHRIGPAPTEREHFHFNVDHHHHQQFPVEQLPTPDNFLVGLQLRPRPPKQQQQSPPPVDRYGPTPIQLRTPNYRQPTANFVLRHELNLFDNKFDQRHRNRLGMVQTNRQNEQQQQQQIEQLDDRQQRKLIIADHRRPVPLLATVKTTTTTTTTATETDDRNRSDERQQLKLFKSNRISLDIDECLDERACGKGATCENLPGSFRCSCPAGFVGDPAVECVGE